MAIRSILNSAGGTLDVFPETGTTIRIELTVAAGWVKLPLAASCDLYELDTTLAAGGKRVVSCHTGDRPGLTAGVVPSTEDLAKAAPRWPGVWTRGSDRTKGVEIFVALDPTDPTEQTAPAVLFLTQAAEV